MSDLNQPNLKRKKFVWTTRYKRQLEMFIVQHVEMKSLFRLQPKKRLVSTTVKIPKPATTFWIFLLRTKNWQLFWLAVMVHIVLQEKRVATTKEKRHLYFWRSFPTNHIPANPNLNRKRLKILLLEHSRVDTPLLDTVKWNFIYILIFCTFSLQSSNMILSVSNDGIERSFHFAPESVILTVKYLSKK